MLSNNDLSQLAIATLGVTFAGSWLALRGDGSEKARTPPTNASSKDEEAFIQYRPLRHQYLKSTTNPSEREFLKSAESEEKKAKH